MLKNAPASLLAVRSVAIVGVCDSSAAFEYGVAVELKNVKLAKKGQIFQIA